MGEEKKKVKCKCCLIIGGFIIAVGIFTDYIGLGSRPGIGIHQIGIIALGVVVLLFGLLCGSKCGRCCKSQSE